MPRLAEQIYGTCEQGEVKYGTPFCLIIISGYPCSGKTYRARQILEYFQDRIANGSSEAGHENTDNHDNVTNNSNNKKSNPRRLKVHHISDDTLAVPRSVYHDAKTEKTARATFYSAVKRVLSPEDVVVADGMNYIKGFRYQLHCEAKALRTACCVIHIGTPIERCRENNRNALGKRDAEKDGVQSGYEESVFENLVYRYEEPNGMTRWDSPLFTVLYDDPHPPYEQIWNALIETDGQTKAVRPNQATVLKPPTEQNYLYELDRSTSEVMSRILEWQRDHPGEGGELTMPELGATINLPMTNLSLPHLQRLRRQFINLNRQHDLKKDRIKHLFVDYLNDKFDTD